jgi:hypothetical protein
MRGVKIKALWKVSLYSLANELHARGVLTRAAVMESWRAAWRLEQPGVLLVFSTRNAKN